MLVAYVTKTNVSMGAAFNKVWVNAISMRGLGVFFCVVSVLALSVCVLFLLYYYYIIIIYLFDW